MTLTVDFDCLPRTFYMPTGGSVTVRFVDKSISTTSQLGPWAWTFGDGGTSTEKNPTHVYTAAGTYTVSLHCEDADTSATTTKTAWVKIEAGTFSPPSQASAYRNITLFVYERSSESSPKSTCICRTRTAACNLYYQNLTINGAITKAGKATFQIVNNGSGSANEIDLFESATTGRYKNIAIVAGYDVIWSGKITKADKELKSQPGTSPQKAVYTCEAYSDVRKLSDWNVISGSLGTQTQTPGRITAAILATNSGEPDFIGTRGGYIDYSGAKISQTLTDIDKLSAFSTLASATDYDWRTRMETMLFQYATFNGSNQVTITSAGLTASALVGNWLLFPTENYLNSGVSTPNYTGILAWGIITANTSTTITATLAGASAIPTATDNCLVVQIPRMDFSSDLTETNVVRAFTNNANLIKFTNSDNKDDLFTKVIEKGTASFASPLESTALSGNESVISAGISAKDAWDSTAGMFENSTVITQKTDGYVYSYAASATTIVLIGQGYAIQVGDTFFVYGIKSDNSTQVYGTKTVTAITTQTQSDGTLTTTIAFSSGYLDTIALMKYSVFVLTKIYVADNTVISTDTDHYVGIEKRTLRDIGDDSVYGPSASITSSGDIGVGSTKIVPHLPGCIISQTQYTETSPQSGSPVAVHGIISKSITASTSTTYPDLEVAASAALLQGSTYYQKSTATISYYQFCANRVRDGVQLTKPALIREGQRISVVPYTGGTAIERQVVEWTLDTMTMIISITLGDYVKDVWNYLNTSTAATQKTLI